MVIGAGAAGLASADRLAQAGRDVLVVEARERTGGRVLTLHEPGAPLPLELGAEFVHGAPDETMELIDAAGLALYDAADTHHRRREGRLREADDYWDLVRPVLDALDPDGADVSFDAFLRDRFGGAEHADARRAAARYVEGFHAADLALIGTRALARAESGSASGSSSASRVLGGYAAVLARLRRRAAEGGAEFRLSAPVRAVTWRPRDGRVRLTGGEELHARAVVLAVPLAVLRHAALPTADGGGPAVDPLPPEWTRDWGALHTGHVVRTVLHFSEIWWPRGCSFVHHSESRRWQLWWTPAPVRAPLLTGWCGGPPAARLARLSAAERVAAAVEELSELFDMPAARIRSLLLQAYEHDWAGDPFALGAYTYAAPGGEEAAERMASVVGETLVLAGEAVAPPGRHGSVDGAIASGRRAAERLLAVL